MSSLAFLCIVVISFCPLVCQAEVQRKNRETASNTALSTIIVDVTEERARELLAGEQPPVVIDIRTLKEFKKGHIEGAQMIDYKAANFRKELAKLDRNQTYLFYCRSGVRSRRSFAIWKELGFRKIYHLDSGILGWQKRGKGGDGPRNQNLR